MASVEELVRLYETAPALQKEVRDILADGKVSVSEFIGFAKKHHIDVSLKDMPRYMDEAKKLGFVK